MMSMTVHPLSWFISPRTTELRMLWPNIGSRNIATATSRAVPKGTYKCPESWSAELEAATRTCDELLSQLDSNTTPGQLHRIVVATKARKELLTAHCRKTWGGRAQKLNPSDPKSWDQIRRIASVKKLTSTRHP